MLEIIKSIFNNLFLFFKSKINIDIKSNNINGDFNNVFKDIDTVKVKNK